MYCLKFFYINVLFNSYTYLESSFGWYSENKEVMFQHLPILIKQLAFSW